MSFPAIPLLQAAVEYGAAASASTGAGVSGSTIPGGDGPLANLQSAVAGPPGVIGAGVFLVWLLTRRRSTGASGGLLGHAIMAAIGLGAAYVILRWQGML